MEFLLEKFIRNGYFENVKEYTGVSYEEVKKDIESMYGKCNFSVADIDSPITWV